MNHLNKHLLLLAVWDLVRFVVLSILLLPLLGAALSISPDQSSNFRLILWLAAPQLIIPLYLGAVSVGIMGGGGVKALSLTGKLLSTLPGLATVSGILISARNSAGGMLDLVTEFRTLSAIGLVLLLDIVFCIILVAYRNPKAGEEPGQ